MQALQTIVILVALFGSIFGVFYLHYTTRNKERMALIEKGAEASLFKIGRDPREKASFGQVFNVLKIGLFFIGGGVGVIAGYLLSIAGMDSAAAYLSMIFIGSGSGLVVYYLISRNKTA